MRRSVVSACLLLALAGLSAAQAPPASPRPSAILVELFTSEGCSDCPPADALLRAISGTHLAEGSTIIALSEHVDYWDNLGWQDAYSQHLFTARQSGYSNRFHLDDVYTPQMIVDGTEQFVGGNRVALLDALHKQASRPHIGLRILSVVEDGKSLVVQFSAQNVTRGARLDIMAALSDDLAQTHVLHGENGDRTLTHVAVARSLQRVAEVQSDGTQTVRVPLPSSLPAGTLRHLTLFAQQHDLGAILGADTEALAPPGPK